MMNVRSGEKTVFKRFNRSCVYVLILALLLAGSFQFGYAEEENPGQKRINIGYLRGAFTGADLKDVQTALELWVEKIAAKMKLNYKSRIILYDDIDSLIKAVETGELDAANINPLDYLRVKDNTILEPRLLNIKGTEILEEYLLLVNGKKGYDKLAQLKGKKIAVRIEGENIVPIVWLDTMLLNEGQPDSRRFFRELKKVKKTSQAILPVFFGQIDACIVSRDAFNTTSELNPQISKDLKILLSSPGFITAIMCFRKDYDQQSKDLIKETGMRLHEEPDGEQILTLFRIRKVGLYDPSYLESLEDMVRKHDELTGKNK